MVRLFGLLCSAQRLFGSVWYSARFVWLFPVRLVPWLDGWYSYGNVR